MTICDRYAPTNAVRVWTHPHSSAALSVAYVERRIRRCNTGAGPDSEFSYYFSFAIGWLIAGYVCRWAADSSLTGASAGV